MTPAGTLPTTKLQKIDLWFGVPVCWLFTLVALVGTPAPPAGPPTGKVLFIKLAEQGSTVLAQAAIRRAVDMVGRENVFFVVFAENRFILDLLDLIPRENVFIIHAGSFGSLVTSGWNTLGRIRRMRFESAVDLEFFARFSAAFCFLTGARRRVGFHTFYSEGPYRGDLMTHRLLYNPYLHTSQIFTLMVEALRADPAQLPTFGVEPPDADEAPAAFRPAPEEIETVRAILQRETGGRAADAPLILLNANASDLLPLRRWAPERYVELARRLLDALPDACVVMTGAPAEAAAGERLAEAIGRALFFARGQDESASVARALHAGGSSRHQRQRPGAFRVAHADQRRDAFRAGNAAPFRRAHAAQRRALERHRVQPVRQRVQQPPVALPQQRVHAAHHGRPGVRGGVRGLPPTSAARRSIRRRALTGWTRGLRVDTGNGHVGRPPRRAR